MATYEMPSVEAINSVCSDIVAQRKPNHDEYEKNGEKCEICTINFHLTDEKEAKYTSDLDELMQGLILSFMWSPAIMIMDGARELQYVYRLAFWIGYRTRLSMDQAKEMESLMTLGDTDSFKDSE